MSHEHVSAVFADEYFTPARKPEFLVALALAEWTNLKSGICWPSVESIAKRARVSIRGAQEALRQLSNDGKLQVDVQKHQSGTSVYRLAVEPPPAQPAPSPPHSLHPGVQSSGAGLHPEPEGTVPSLSPPSAADFVAYFSAKMADLGQPLPLSEYLECRRSDFAAVGWKKGNRAIEDWRELLGSLTAQYRNDHAERKQRGQNGRGGSLQNPRVTQTLNNPGQYPKSGVIGGRKPGAT